MYPQHIIHGKPAAFAKSVNQLVASRDVAMSMRGISFNGGTIAAVVEESYQGQGASGSLIEAEAQVVKDPQKFIEDLTAQNPMWKVDAVFAIPSAKEESKAKASVLVVATLRQP